MAKSQGIASGVTQKILTHEVGAGAPCLKCGDKCPGLDLHFWRKICRNCKCPQENHDVNASVSSRGMDNIEKLLQQDSTGDSVKKLKPTANENASAPSENKPIVTKISAPPPAPKPAKKDPIDPPITQTIPSSELHQNGDLPKILNPPNFQTKLKRDFEDVPAEADFLLPPPSFSPPPVIEDLPTPPPPENVPFENKSPSPTPPIVEEFEQSVSLAEDPPEFISPARTESLTNTIIASEQSEPISEISQDQALPEPPTRVPMNDVTATTNSFPPKKTKENTGYKSVDEFSLSSLSTENDLEAEYEWSPAASSKPLIEKYIKALPKEKQPIIGSEGAKYRKKQLMRQLPPHDQEPKECHDLSSQETDEMQMFVKQYRQKALGVASVEEGMKMKTCAECEQALGIGEAVVLTERAGSDKQWHPGCFVCAECKELLVDLIYFYNDDNKVYCGRHYCELHKPRCSACDELIFAPEYTQAEESHWHLKHFCCWHCDQPLGGKNYVPHDNQPICIPCYEKTFAHSCATCKQIIAPNTEWVTFEKFHWHARPECFKCIECDMSLVGKPCIPKGESVFCSSKCKREWLAKPQQ